jgi:4'-phosphopantetheinyl transferase EntD
MQIENVRTDGTTAVTVAHGRAGSTSTLADRRASRLAARRAVGQLVGDDAPVAITRRPGRAPKVRLLGHDARELAVSLTHRDGCAAAIAAPAGARVGIDLEREHVVRPEHAHYFLTPRERVGRTLPLVSLWALKEAAWKALALGGDVEFHALELELTECGVLRALWLRGVRHAVTASLTSPWPGWVLATVQLEDGC